MANQLVKMQKDGETIAVSPLVVNDHKRLGWVEVAGAVQKAAPKNTESESSNTTPEAKGPTLGDKRKAYLAELNAKSDEEIQALATEKGVEPADRRGKPRNRNQVIGELINIWNAENKE